MSYRPDGGRKAPQSNVVGSNRYRTPCVAGDADSGAAAGAGPPGGDGDIEAADVGDGARRSAGAPLLAEQATARHAAAAAAAARRQGALLPRGLIRCLPRSWRFRRTRSHANEHRRLPA
jgi:hypothetical protein